MQGGLRERIVLGELAPLGERDGVDGLVEGELIGAQLSRQAQEFGARLARLQIGIPAVDVRAHLLEAERREALAEPLRWQLRLPTDAAKKKDVDGH